MSIKLAGGRYQRNLNWRLLRVTGTGTQLANMDIRAKEIQAQPYPLHLGTKHLVAGSRYQMRIVRQRWLRAPTLNLRSTWNPPFSNVQIALVSRT